MKTNLSFFVLILLSVACGSSREVTYSSNTLNFWDILSYHPSSDNQIVGEYLYSTGFGGEYLKLEADGSYFQKLYTHLQDPANIIDGYRGRYQISADTLFLKFESFQLKPKQAREPLQADSLIYSSMYSMQFLPNPDSLTYEDSVKKTLEFQERFKTDEQFSRYHQLNYYHIKSAGETIFLVKSNFKDFFLNELEKQNDLFKQNIKGEQIIFQFHLTKLK